MKLATTALIVFFAACGKSSKTTYDCNIGVSKKAPPAVEAHAESQVSLDEAKAAAWKDACAKLPAEQQADCHDSKKFSASEMGGSASAGGPTTYSMTVKLEQRTEQFRGFGKSAKDADEACKLAREDACKLASLPADCTRSADYDVTPEGRGKETTSY